jgi:uncharacterized protein
MLVVLSPSKTLAPGPVPVPAGTTEPAFLARSAALVRILRELDLPELASLMGISEALAAVNVARFQAWRRPFTADNARPAILAFRGDVYEGLDAGTLDAEDLAFAQGHLRILSGLYGLLRPLDLMQDYRLEMGTRLANPVGKDLYAFWGDRIAAHLRGLRKGRQPVLLNLASAEYFKVLEGGPLRMRVIAPRFEDFVSGRYQVVSFHAKRARGLMARHIVRHRVEDPEGLRSFDAEGYRLVPEAAGGGPWVWRRDRG